MLEVLMIVLILGVLKREYQKCLYWSERLQIKQIDSKVL